MLCLVKSRLPIAFGFAAFAAAPAMAQTPVHARMHSSSGNCASCDLSEKSMARMRLVDANFANSNFYRSNLSGGLLDRSDLSGAVFTKAFLVSVKGEAVNLSGAILRDATLTDAELKSSRFVSADMRRADLSRGDFSGSDFSSADLSSSNLRDAVMTGANFREARLRMASLDGSDLSGADLQGATADDVSFAETNLSEANLSGADLRNARSLTQEQLNGACGDANTILPVSLSIGYCDPSVVAEFQSRTSAQDYAQAVARLEAAIVDVEAIIAQPDLDARSRRRLQRVHSQLVGSRRSLGN